MPRLRLLFFLLMTTGLAAQQSPSAFTIDVYPTGLKASPTTWKPNDSVAFTVDIVNASLFSGVGAHENAIVYSHDSSISTSDVLLRILPSTGIPWASYQRWNANFTVSDAWLFDGKGYLGCVADSKNQIAETFEGNNSTGFGVTGVFPKTDVAPTMLAHPSRMTAGTSYSVQFQVANHGGIDAKDVRTALFLSENSTISTQDELVGYEFESIPAHGKGGVHTKSAHLPCTYASGTRYLAAMADYGAWLKSEKTRSNDVLRKSFTCVEPDKTHRLLEFRPSLYYSTRSFEFGEGYGQFGGELPMLVKANGAHGGSVLLAWSLSSNWRIDAATEFSLGLLNNPYWFPGWFRQLSSTGTGYPLFRLPKGTKLPGTLNFYTQAFFWDSRFRFLGPSDRVIKTTLRP